MNLPPLKLKLPAVPPRLSPPTVVRISDSIACCAAGGAVRVDIVGEINAGRITAMLTPDQARKFAIELSWLLKNLS